MAATPLHAACDSNYTMPLSATLPPPRLGLRPCPCVQELLGGLWGTGSFKKGEVEAVSTRELEDLFSSHIVNC